MSQLTQIVKPTCGVAVSGTDGLIVAGGHLKRISTILLYILRPLNKCVQRQLLEFTCIVLHSIALKITVITLKCASTRPGSPLADCPTDSGLLNRCQQLPNTLR